MQKAFKSEKEKGNIFKGIEKAFVQVIAVLCSGEIKFINKLQYVFMFIILIEKFIFHETDESIFDQFCPDARIMFSTLARDKKRDPVSKNWKPQQICFGNSALQALASSNQFVRAVFQHMKHGCKLIKLKYHFFFVIYLRCLWKI